jgi:outer membrane protein assembly factor BamB
VRNVNGTFSLEPDWTSSDLTSPATPIIVNGVVFALSRGRTGSPAVLFAHDGVSGRALWNSGKAMSASASPGSFWSALSQVYVGADDGTIYAFGFADERR